MDKDFTQKTRRRLAWLKLAIVAGLISGLLLSPRLWVSGRVYPLTPLFGQIPPLPYPADYIFLSLFFALLAAVAVFRGRWAGSFALLAFFLAVFFVLQDVSRLQPWFYQYSFMLAAVGLSGLGRLGAESALNACRLIVAFTYLWSGLQKANASFVQSTYPWIIEPLASHLPSSVSSALSWGAYAVPAVEAASGLGLLVRPLRNSAVIGAILMHTFIMLSLGPWGHDWNTVVWPWNIAMVAFVFILFWRVPDNPSLLQVLRPTGAFQAAVLILFAFMPSFSFLGLWDSYLSSSLYSGNTKEGYIWNLYDSRLTSTSVLDLSMKEMNVPTYPEEWVFKNVFAAGWCQNTEAPKPILVVYSKPDISSGERSIETYNCADVQPEGS